MLRLSPLLNLLCFIWPLSSMFRNQNQNLLFIWGNAWQSVRCMLSYLLIRRTCYRVQKVNQFPWLLCKWLFISSSSLARFIQLSIKNSYFSIYWPQGLKNIPIIGNFLASVILNSRFVLSSFSSPPILVRTKSGEQTSSSLSKNSLEILIKQTNFVIKEVQMQKRRYKYKQLQIVNLTKLKAARCGSLWLRFV